jgi:hypothetical protein
MFTSRAKMASALVLAAGLGAVGGRVATPSRLTAQQAVPALPEEPPQAKVGAPRLTIASEKRVRSLLEASSADPKVKALLRDRFDAARRGAEERWQQYLAGRGTLDILIEVSMLLLEAERDLSDRKADHVVALKNCLQNLKYFEEVVTAQYRAGRASGADFEQARLYRLRVQIWLERAAEK